MEIQMLNNRKTKSTGILFFLSHCKNKNMVTLTDSKAWTFWIIFLSTFFLPTSMAAALECWSRRTTSDEDDAFLTAHSSQPRDSSSSSSPSSSLVHKKLLKLTRNVSEALSSLRNSLTAMNDSSKPDAPRNLVWTTVVRNLSHIYPGTHLPEKLVCNIRKHYDSLPLRFGSQPQFARLRWVGNECQCEEWRFSCTFLVCLRSPSTVTLFFGHALN